MRKRASRSVSAAERVGVLGDAVRLRMLRVLESQELSVGEIARVVQLAQSTVSRHLKALADTGWLVRRSEGPATMYRVVLDELEPSARGVWLAVRDEAAPGTVGVEDSRRLAAVIAERRTDSEAFFGRVAGQWDTVREQLFGDRFTLPALVSLLPKGWVVADLGCGTGNASEVLAPVAERVLAVDISEPMLSAARRRLAGRRNVDFVRSDAGRLPMSDQSLDAAVAILVLHHMEDPAALVREAARCLRTDRGGGELLVVDMVRHEREDYRRTMGHLHLGFSGQAVRGMFEDAGLVGVVVRELPRDPSAKGPGLFVATGRKKG